jgi:hypothetical protein
MHADLQLAAEALRADDTLAQWAEGTLSMRAMLSSTRTQPKARGYFSQSHF